VGLVIALLVMVAGVAGSVLPGLPGPPPVLAAAIGHRLYFGAASVSNAVLAVMAGLMVLSLVLDYVASLLGAKKLGATWRGMIGAVLGAAVGLCFPPLGLVLGPFLGAVALEMASGRQFKEASRAGFGALLGLLASAAGKVACSLAMVGMFLIVSGGLKLA